MGGHGKTMINMPPHYVAHATYVTRCLHCFHFTRTKFLAYYNVYIIKNSHLNKTYIKCAKKRCYRLANTPYGVAIVVVVVVVVAAAVITIFSIALFYACRLCHRFCIRFSFKKRMVEGEDVGNKTDRDTNTKTEWKLLCFESFARVNVMPQFKLCAFYFIFHFHSMFHLFFLAFLVA